MSTKRDMCKFRRGMVFWAELDKMDKKQEQAKIVVSGKTYDDHIQKGNRPWLIVSNDKGNLEGDIVTVVPLTLSKHGFHGEDFPTHVILNSPDYRGDSIVLCEQIRCANKCQLTDYYGTLDEESMSRVEDAIMISLGIQRLLKGTSKSTLYNIEEIIESIVRQKIEQYKRMNVVFDNDIDDTALRIGDKLEELFKVSMPQPTIGQIYESKKQSSSESEDVKKPVATRRSLQGDSTKQKIDDKDVDVKERPLAKINTDYSSNKSGTGIKSGMSPVEKFNRRASVSEQMKNSKNTKTGKDNKKSRKGYDYKPTRIRWTEENMKEFLDDIEKKPLTEVAKKWGYSTPKKVCQMKYYVQNKLDGLA